MNMIKKTPAEGGLRTSAESEAVADIVKAFETSNDTVAQRLQTFPRYVRRQDMTRLLACYEVFKRVLHIKGSIIDCGIFRGFSLMSWANFSAVLEPNNLTRRIYGFDSFEGFPETGNEDKSSRRTAKRGDLRANSYEELLSLIAAYDKNRFLGHVPKVELVKGNATQTIPTFIQANPHLVVSLLFLDFDLYEPTKMALEQFVPRMPKGSILAFDELDNPIWPGETLALLKSIGIRELKIERMDFDPYIGFAVL